MDVAAIYCKYVLSDSISDVMHQHQLLKGHKRHLCSTLSLSKLSHDGERIFFFMMMIELPEKGRSAFLLLCKHGIHKSHIQISAGFIHTSSRSKKNRSLAPKQKLSFCGLFKKSAKHVGCVYVSVSTAAAGKYISPGLTALGLRRSVQIDINIRRWFVRTHSSGS